MAHGRCLLACSLLLHGAAAHGPGPAAHGMRVGRLGRGARPRTVRHAVRVRHFRFNVAADVDLPEPHTPLSTCSISALSPRRRRHVYRAGMAVPVLRMTASATPRWCRYRAHVAADVNLPEPHTPLGTHARTHVHACAHARTRSRTPGHRCGVFWCRASLASTTTARSTRSQEKNPKFYRKSGTSPMTSARRRKLARLYSNPHIDPSSVRFAIHSAAESLGEVQASPRNRHAVGDTKTLTLARTCVCR